MSIIQFSPKGPSDEDFETFFESVPDFDEMDAAALKDYRKEVEALIAALDRCEPKNMESEAYETWADRHEELEDILDDILDTLDELD